jgi:macrolide-specific efflux system membrane fusion protein
MKKIKIHYLFILLGAGIVLFLILPILRGPQQRVEQAVVTEVVDAIYSLGTVEADKVYNLRFGVAATITSLSVNEGDFVQKGDLLLIRDTSLEFRAPFDGVVTSLKYNNNELIPVGDTVLTVTSFEQLYVTVSLDQESILYVKEGQSTEISFENLRNQKVNGTVKKVYPSDGDFYVIISADTLPDNVLPEMSCDVAIEVSNTKEALVIPSTAVVDNTVKVKRGDKHEDVEVETSIIDDETVEIVSGEISPNDLILVSDLKRRP